MKFFKAASIGAAGLAVAVLLAGHLAGSAAYALQGPPRPGIGPGGPPLPRLQQLARELNLTEAQKTQIRGYLEDARTQLRSVRNDGSLTREQKMDQSQQIVQQTRDQIRSALTPEQQARADQLRADAEARFAERREQMQQRMLTRMTERLGLTESQQSSIRLYLEDQRAQLQALRDNSALSASQRFEQMRSIHQRTQEQIRALLTPDQQAQLDQMREQARNRMRGRCGPGGFRGGRGFRPRGFAL